MSPAARWILGIACLLCTVGFTVVGALAFRVALLFAAFSGLITIACFSKRLRGASIRGIGATVFATYVWYVWMSWGTVDFVKALLGLGLFGLPGGYVACRGGYPSWGYVSEVFQSDDDPDAGPIGPPPPG